MFHDVRGEPPRARIVIAEAKAYKAGVPVHEAAREPQRKEEIRAGVQQRQAEAVVLQALDHRTVGIDERLYRPHLVVAVGIMAI